MTIERCDKCVDRFIEGMKMSSGSFLEYMLGVCWKVVLIFLFSSGGNIFGKENVFFAKLSDNPAGMILSFGVEDMRRLSQNRVFDAEENGDLVCTQAFQTGRTGDKVRKTSKEWILHQQSRGFP